jgi:hypothetical protein
MRDKREKKYFTLKKSLFRQSIQDFRRLAQLSAEEEIVEQSRWHERVMQQFRKK